MHCASKDCAAICESHSAPHSPTCEAFSPGPHQRPWYWQQRGIQRSWDTKAQVGGGARSVPSSPSCGTSSGRCAAYLPGMTCTSGPAAPAGPVGTQPDRRRCTGRRSSSCAHKWRGHGRLFRVQRRACERAGGLGGGRTKKKACHHRGPHLPLGRGSEASHSTVEQRPSHVLTQELSTSAIRQLCVQTRPQPADVLQREPAARHEAPPSSQAAKLGTNPWY